MIDIFEVVIERTLRDILAVKDHLNCDLIEAILFEEVGGTLDQSGLGGVGRLWHGPIELKKSYLRLRQGPATRKLKCDSGPIHRVLTKSGPTLYT